MLFLVVVLAASLVAAEDPCKKYKGKSGLTCIYQNGEVKILFSHNREREYYSSGHENNFDVVKFTYKSGLPLVKSVVKKFSKCTQRFHMKALNVADVSVFMVGEVVFSATDADCHNCAAALDPPGKMNLGKVKTADGYINKKRFLPLREIRIGDTGSSNEWMKISFAKLECIEENPCRKYRGKSGLTCTIQNGIATISFDHNREKVYYSSGYENNFDNVKITYKSGLPLVKSAVHEFSKCTQSFHVKALNVANYSVFMKTVDGSKLKMTAADCHNCAAALDAPNKMNLGKVKTADGYINKKSLLPLRGILIGDTGSSNEWMRISFGKLVCTTQL